MDGDAGAILMLALVYIVVISTIVLALASWATNDLTNTTHFSSTGQLENAASSATNVAIQSIRYNPIPTNTPTQLEGTTPSGCWTPTGSGPSGVSQLTFSSGPINDPVSVTVAVWCSTYEYLKSDNTRIVTFYACQSDLTSNSTASNISAAQASCVDSPFLRAVVSFDDYPSLGSAPLNVQCNDLGSTESSCGLGITLESWNWSPGAPITQILPSETGTVTVASSSTFSSQLAVTGSNGTVSYTLTGGPNEADFSVTSSGAITTTGTLGVGNYTAAGTDTDASGNTGTWAFVLTVTPSILTTAPTSATVSVDNSANFSQTLATTGSHGALTYVQSSAGQSSSLTFTASTGVITSTGTAVLPVGVYTVNGTTSDADGDTGTWTFTLTVTKSTITQNGTGNATDTSSPATSANISVKQLAVTGNNGTVTYTETTSTYSTDIVVSSSGAVTISGTSLTGSNVNPKQYTVTGTDTDTDGDTGTWTYTLTVS